MKKCWVQRCKSLTSRIRYTVNRISRKLLYLFVILLGASCLQIVGNNPSPWVLTSLPHCFCHRWGYKKDMSISFSASRSMTCVDPGHRCQSCGSDSGHFEDCHASQDQVLITKWSCMLMQWACRIQSNNKEKLLLYWNHCRNIAYIAGSCGS